MTDTPQKITNWVAQRSGPSITISGWIDGKRAKITGVAEIAADSDGPLATLKAEGDAEPVTYRLA